jgi:hypothetical protein
MALLITGIVLIDIHASRRLDTWVMAWFTKHKIQLPKDLPTGFILGKCELVDITDGNEGQRFGSGSLVQKVGLLKIRDGRLVL